jgi:hypothetical protein
MLRNVKALERYQLQAEDGPVGSVRDFYFDDLSWTVRYVVVNTGGWLRHRQVLIAPEALGRPAWEEEAVLPVRLTREQIKNSPDIDTAKPVSRQHEAELRTYYDWPLYWELVFIPPPVEPQAVREEPVGDPHLRSTSEVIGDRLEAADGEIGHVTDVLVDDQKWSLRYLVVDTRNWWPGRKVVISPRWVTAIDWAGSHVTVPLTRAQIKGSPTYDPLQPLDQVYADRLHDYYVRPRHEDEEIADAILRNDNPNAP